MAKNVEKLTLGGGDLYLNNVEVGYLEGDVTFSYERTVLDFKPANTLALVKRFIVGETATMKASLAELKLANLKLAMGVTTTIESDESFPAYDPSSYDPEAGASWDSMSFGGSKALDEMSLRFEHTRPDGDKVIVIF